MEEKVINEEYKIWKKNSPFLYDLCITHALEWPSLTVQWFPDVKRPEGKEYSVHRLLLGTHTSDAEPNYLQVAEVHLPNDTVTFDGTEESGGYGGAEARIKVTQKILHDGEVNRARYMPQNPHLVATRTVEGTVCIFDLTKHSLTPPANQTHSNPDIKLVGLKDDGFGLAWNPVKKGQILSASDGKVVALWDVESYSKGNKELAPLHMYTKGHNSVVEDVAWHCQHDSLFASVGDDSHLLLWDTRNHSVIQKATGHVGEIYTVAFNPGSEFLLATGGADKNAMLWDMRNLKTSLHTFSHHQDEIVQLAWSPHNETILATSSADRRLNIWDLSRIGADDEMLPEEREDGPAELLFVHGGHTNRIPDFSWNLNDPWTICSVAEDNVAQVWQMSSNIYSVDDSAVPGDL